MATIDAADAHPETGGAIRRRTSLLIAVLTVLTVLGVLGASVGIWQWRSVDVFGSQGNLIPWNDLEPGETALVLAALPEPDDRSPSIITVHAVEPQIIEGDLPVEVLVCHRDRMLVLGSAQSRAT